MKRGLIYTIVFILCIFYVDGAVVINEFLPDPIGYDNASMPNGEWVELYNNGSDEINLSGFVLYDSIDSNELYITEDNVEGDLILQPKDYTVVYRNGDSDFSLNNNGDKVRLYDGYPVRESNLIDNILYGNYLVADSGMSLCKLNNSWYECNPTPGYNNTEGIIGNYSVSRVIDGDTLVLENGEHVRLIGIDTPEVGEFYYEEATERLRELVEGRNVTLERDVENIDMYDRLLRYIYINNTFVNLLLVEEGFARAFPFEPNTQYIKDFGIAEMEAKKNRIGMWFYSPNVTILNPEDDSIINTNSFWLNVTTDQNSTCEYTISHSWDINEDNNSFDMGYVVVSHPRFFNFSNGFVHSELITNYYNTNDSLNEIYGLEIECTNEYKLFSSEDVYFTVNIPEYYNLTGDISDVQTNINLTLDIGNLTNGTRRVSFMEGNKTIVFFDFNFNEYILNLSNIRIERQTGNTSGSILIKGINLTNSTKTVYIDNLDDGVNTVCIKDVEIASIDEISGNCNGDDELMITCDGNEDRGYTCSEEGDKYKITGLKHSGVREQAQINNNNNNGGNNNPGGGSNNEDENNNRVNNQNEDIPPEESNEPEPQENPEENNIISNQITGAFAFLGEGDPKVGGIIMVAIIVIGLLIYFFVFKRS